MTREEYTDEFKIKPEKNNVKLSSLLNRVLEKYPELIVLDIHIRYRKLNNAHASTGSFKNVISISIDEELRNKTESLKIGAIASELSHYVGKYNIKNMNIIKVFFKYKLSKKYRKEIECEADRETINRGFGNELLALMKYDNEDVEDGQEDDGLSIQEISILLESDENP